jgi:hypothetical protein
VVAVVPALQPEPINPDDSEMEIASHSNFSKSLSDRSNVPLVPFNAQSQKLNVDVVRTFGSERINSTVMYPRILGDQIFDSKQNISSTV